MSTAQTIVLGGIAGLTIFLGLPLGRVRTASVRGRAFLNAASAGILVFLLWDILTHATDRSKRPWCRPRPARGPGAASRG